MSADTQTGVRIPSHIFMKWIGELLRSVVGE